MNITEKLAIALRGLPDEDGMIEHNPDEGPRLFCCGGDIVETLRSTTRKHAPDCWYVQAVKALAEYDAQARIDALMLEYCPDEMTPEQVAEWARHQQPARSTGHECMEQKT